MSREALAEISGESHVGSVALNQATNKVNVVHGAKPRRASRAGAIPLFPLKEGDARASLFELRRAPCFAGSGFPTKFQHPMGVSHGCAMRSPKGEAWRWRELKAA